MTRKDKLEIIHKSFKLLAPNKEYDLSDYDVFYYDAGAVGYLQIFCVNRSIFIESTIEIPVEVSTLFKLHKLSDMDEIRIYDIIEKNTGALDTIRPASPDACLYRATPISRNLFKAI